MSRDVSALSTLRVRIIVDQSDCQNGVTIIRLQLVDKYLYFRVHPAVGIHRRVGNPDGNLSECLFGLLANICPGSGRVGPSFPTGPATMGETSDKAAVITDAEWPDSGGEWREDPRHG